MDSKFTMYYIVTEVWYSVFRHSINGQAKWERRMNHFQSGKYRETQNRKRKRRGNTGAWNICSRASFRTHTSVAIRWRQTYKMQIINDAAHRILNDRYLQFQCYAKIEREQTYRIARFTTIDSQIIYTHTHKKNSLLIALNIELHQYLQQETVIKRIEHI